MIKHAILMTLVVQCVLCFRMEVPLRKSTSPKASIFEKQNLPQNSLFNEVLAAKTVFDSLEDGFLNGNHIVAEFLPYINRADTAQKVVNAFEGRRRARATTTSFMDKMVNPLIALPGIAGSGKSTFLAHFPTSTEYLAYTKATTRDIHQVKPLVSLLTFNSAMGEAVGVALGLRVIYGALFSSCGITESWAHFSDRHADLSDMSAWRATCMLRKVFGESRNFLIGVDEISKADQYSCRPVFISSNDVSSMVVAQLGEVLNQDGCSDILVSALNPTFVKSLLSLSQRPIQYVPITPLRASSLDSAFRESGEGLVRKVQVKRCAQALGPGNEFNLRMLRNIHLLACGHPRTLQLLISHIDSVALQSIVSSLCSPCDTTEPHQLLRRLCRLQVFKELTSPPRGEVEREYILSHRARVPNSDHVFRKMLEEARCTISKQIDSGKFQVTTTLASFFQMLDELRQGKDRAHLGPLSRAADALFNPQQGHDFSIAQLWERAHCLSTVSRVHGVLSALDEPRIKYVGNILGLNTYSTFGCPVALQDNLEVELAYQGDAMPWRRDTIYVAPPNHAGFDIRVCLLGADGDKICVYEEVKVAQNQKALESTMADKLAHTLRHHLQQAGLADEPVAVQLEALSGVYFVLSVYGTELPGDMCALRAAVVAHVQRQPPEKEEEKNKKISDSEKNLLLGFVERFGDSHVAFQGTAEMDAAMVPVTLPLAELMQSVAVAPVND